MFHLHNEDPPWFLDDTRFTFRRKAVRGSVGVILVRAFGAGVQLRHRHEVMRVTVLHSKSLTDAYIDRARCIGNYAIIAAEIGIGPKYGEL